MRASTAANKAELLIAVGNATGEPQYLVQQADVQARSTKRSRQFPARRGSRTAVRGWANLYIMPIVGTFAAPGKPPPPFEELVAHMASPTRPLQSARRRPREPGLARQLVDPDAVGGDPAKLPNPVTAITKFNAAEHHGAASRMLLARAEANELGDVALFSLYGAGMVLVFLVVGVTLHFGRSEARAAAENDQLRRLSTTDPLTNLGNRRAFEEAMKRVGARTSGAVALVMIDIDEFKNVNDAFGHGRGDAVLSTFAGLLGKLAPPGVSRFRIGGDEFALIVHGLESASAFELAESVRLGASELVGSGVTVSAGVAMLDGKDRDVALLTQRADAALYEAKMRGRNLSVLYHESGVRPRCSRPRSCTRCGYSCRRPDRRRLPANLADQRRTILGYEGLSRPHRTTD